MRSSLEEVIEEYRSSGEDLFISGGASIYKQCLPIADQLLISRIPENMKVKHIFLILMNTVINWLLKTI